MLARLSPSCMSLVAQRLMPMPRPRPSAAPIPDQMACPAPAHDREGTARCERRAKAGSVRAWVKSQPFRPQSRAVKRSGPCSPPGAPSRRYSWSPLRARWRPTRGARQTGHGFNNYNFGNITPSAAQIAAGVSWMTQNVPHMQYLAFSDAVSGAKDMLKWLSSHGLLAYATANDLAGYMSSPAGRLLPRLRGEDRSVDRAAHRSRRTTTTRPVSLRGCAPCRACSQSPLPAVPFLMPTSLSPPPACWRSGGWAGWRTGSGRGRGSSRPGGRTRRMGVGIADQERCW